jgi:hypothetical protein
MPELEHLEKKWLKTQDETADAKSASAEGNKSKETRRDDAVGPYLLRTKESFRTDWCNKSKRTAVSDNIYYV